jgi:predicted ATPase
LTTAQPSPLLAPYGGRLVNLLVPLDAREALRAHASHLPSVQLSERAVCDLELLTTGAFSPLDRFMGQAAAAMTLATKQGFVQYVARGTVLHGWALAMQGQGEAGIAAIRQGLAAELATGDTLYRPYFLGLLAEAYGAGGHPDEGLAALAEALAVLDTTELRYYAAELSRLKGVLLLQQAVPDTAQAAACFHQALDVARQQQAKSFELRAATSLARLWQSQGKRQEAYDVLAPVYGWFTEGFDTADLQEAKALLEALA